MIDSHSRPATPKYLANFDDIFRGGVSSEIPDEHDAAITALLVDQFLLESEVPGC